MSSVKWRGTAACQSKKPAVYRQRAFSLLVIRLGFEPKTHSLEGCCSIQLSYRTILKFLHEGCPFAKNRTANIGIFYLMAMFQGESFYKFYMPDTQESETGGVRKMYICLFYRMKIPLRPANSAVVMH